MNHHETMHSMMGHGAMNSEPESTTMGMKMDHMAEMKHFFHFDPSVTVLIEKWRPVTSSEVVLTSLGLFVLGFIYEMNKFGQLKFLQLYTPPMYNLACIECCNKDYQLMNDRKMNKYVFQSIYTFLYALQFVLSMLVMLVVMTFNIQYFVSLTLGLAVAHFTWNLSNCNAQYASREGNDAVETNRDYRKESIINHDCCS